MGGSIQKCYISYRDVSDFIRQAHKVLNSRNEISNHPLNDILVEFINSAEKYTNYRNITFERSDQNDQSAVYLFNGDGVLLIPANQNENVQTASNLMTNIYHHVQRNGSLTFAEPINIIQVNVDGVDLMSGSGNTPALREFYQSVSVVLVWLFLDNANKHYKSYADVDHVLEVLLFYYGQAPSAAVRNNNARYARETQCDLKKLKYVAACTLDYCDILYAGDKFNLREGSLIQLFVSRNCWGVRKEPVIVRPSEDRCDVVAPGFYRGFECRPIFGSCGFSCWDNKRCGRW